ncbi:MAG: hypothetical protein IJ094_03850 [Bacilli bacterium]|nr:hypothetical protein [Bacilli bacterium]
MLKKFKFIFVVLFIFSFFITTYSNVFCASTENIPTDILDIYNSFPLCDTFPLHSNYNASTPLLPNLDIIDDPQPIADYINSEIIRVKNSSAEQYTIKDVSNYFLVSQIVAYNSGNSPYAECKFYLLPKDFDYTNLTVYSDALYNGNRQVVFNVPSNLSSYAYSLSFHTYSKGYIYTCNFPSYNADSTFSNNRLSMFPDNTFLSDVTFTDNNGNTYFEVNHTADKEVEIGDPSSRLKLSYEYNEDYTECHVNATLENGAFTDRIFYSNYMPSIAGQGLLSKQSFPRERCNFKRKSVFIFSS